jgi:hypothetical protein
MNFPCWPGIGLKGFNKVRYRHIMYNSGVISHATGIVILILLLITPSAAIAQQLAFPGAEGFGRFATGGRGGSVYHVTNLNDSGPGSFRDAVSQSNRTVVFDVGGIINIGERIVVSSNVTIAGQTAPGDGIVIYGNGMSHSNAHNSITRFIRVRMGVGGSSGKDAMTIARGHDMIFDHISVSWGRDGTFDINYDSGYEVNNITIQNSIISQGLISHSTGGLMQSTGGVSLLRNLWIDNNTRNPKVKGINEFVNNIVYNWDVAAYILGDSDANSYANVINNYFIYGPDTGAAPFTRGNTNFHIYASNNYKDTDKDGLLDGSVIPQAEYGTVDWQSTPYDYPSLTALSPTEAYYAVVSKVGSSTPRDEVDERLITELTSLGTLGQLITNENDPPMNGPGIVNGGTILADTDGDGMPDEWETAVGLDPNSADNNGDINGNGYTNLEDYLNWLAAPHAIVKRNCPVDVDLRQYSSGFGPGASYSLSDSNNGTATLLSDGYTARFAPSRGYSGFASFRYTVDNGYIMTETIEVLVTGLGDWVYGDFTGNDTVEMDDIPYFTDFWLEGDCNETVELDLDDDCIVNFYEFSALADNWKKPPPDINAPSAPTGLWAAAGDGTAWLDWNDNSESDVNGYNVYRSTTSGGGYSQLNSSLLSSSDYTDDTAVNGTMYYYVVTAVDTSENKSSNSVEACAVPSVNGNNITIQENATGFCNLDGDIESEHSGYTGSGYANTENASGEGIDYKIAALSNDTYTFTWRYAHGKTDDRSGRLLVDGSPAVASISFPQTGAWTTWDEVSVDVDLTTGTKDIRLEGTTSNGLANIDYMMVTGPSPQAAGCP